VLKGQRRRLAVGFAVAALLLFLFFRGIDWHALGQAFRSASLLWLCGLLLTTLVLYLLRSWRWGYLLAPLARVPLSDLFSVTMVGFAAGLVIPRAGEVLRPYLIGRRHKISTSAAFASIIVERLLDLATVLALFAVYLFVLPTPATQTKGDLIRMLKLLGAFMALGTLALLGILWAFHANTARAVALVERLLRWLPARASAWISHTLHSFSDGLAVLHAPSSHLLILLGQSVVMWLVIAAGFYCNHRAFGLDLPFHTTFFLIGFLTVGVAIPTPGMVGGFHEFYKLALVQGFGVDGELAVAAGISAHALSNLPVLVLGLLFLGREGLSMRSVANVGGDASKKDGDAENEGGDASSSGGGAAPTNGDASKKDGDAENKGGDSATPKGRGGIP
jgi:uncharacterized protein (TIRG00374 family)